MDLILHYDGSAVVCHMDYQLVGGLKSDIVHVTPKLRHQFAAPSDYTGPTWNFIENLIDDIVGDDIEEMLANDQIAKGAANQIKVRGGGLVISVFRIRHLGCSMHSLECA
jgi:hypothetical protein